MQHTTLVSEAPCLHCRRPLLYAWDEGLLVKADACEIDPHAANTYRARGRRVYVRTHGGNLIDETPQRAGTLRLVRTRHVEHQCPQASDSVRQRPTQLEFDLGTVRPRAQQGGLW